MTRAAPPAGSGTGTDRSQLSSAAPVSTASSLKEASVSGFIVWFGAGAWVRT